MPDVTNNKPAGTKVKKIVSGPKRPRRKRLVVYGFDPSNERTGISRLEIARDRDGMFTCDVSSWSFDPWDQRLFVGLPSPAFELGGREVSVWSEEPSNGSHSSRAGVAAARGMVLCHLMHGAIDGRVHGSGFQGSPVTRGRCRLVPVNKWRKVLGRFPVDDWSKCDSQQLYCHFFGRRAMDHDAAEAGLVALYGACVMFGVPFGEAERITGAEGLR